MSTIQLQEISWPVFRLGEKEPQQESGITFYSTEYVEDTGEITNSRTFRVVDDRNLPGESLGRRRLSLKGGGVTLFPLRTAIYFLVDLIKLSKSTTWWIDSSGRVFQHKKTTRAKLRTFKLKQVLPAHGLGCVLEIEGLVTRFKSISRPEPTQHYVGILSFNKVDLLYGFFEKPIKETWRLV